MSILTKAQREQWQRMIDSHNYMGEPIHWKHWHHDQMRDALETIDALEKERDRLLNDPGAIVKGFRTNRAVREAQIEHADALLENANRTIALIRIIAENMVSGIVSIDMAERVFRAIIEHARAPDEVIKAVRGN